MEDLSISREEFNDDLALPLWEFVAALAARTDEIKAQERHRLTSNETLREALQALVSRWHDLPALSNIHDVVEFGFDNLSAYLPPESMEGMTNRKANPDTKQLGGEVQVHGGAVFKPAEYKTVHAIFSVSIRTADAYHLYAQWPRRRVLRWVL